MYIDISPGPFMGFFHDVVVDMIESTVGGLTYVSFDHKTSNH